MAYRARDGPSTEGPSFDRLGIGSDADDIPGKGTEQGMKGRLLSFGKALVLLGPCLYAAAAMASATVEESMPTIHVYLVDGFRSDRVVARVNGREVFAKDSVTTKHLISLADEFSFEAPDDPVRLEIELPARTLATTIDVDPRSGRYIAVSIEGGRLTHFVSAAPLGFH